MVIDPPERVSSDDDEPVRLLRPRPQWTLFISVPIVGGERGIMLAFELCLRISELNDGATYDPQSEEFVWPDGRREAVEQPEERAVAVLSLQWGLPLSRLSANAANRFLGIADGIMPQVTPRQRNQLLEWARAGLHASHASFSWPGRKPCFEGSAVARRATIRAPGVESWTLELEFDADAVMTSVKQRRAIEALFLAVAQEVGAFYAAAALDLRYIMVGRSLGFVAGDQPQSYVLTPWNGLPRQGAWLTWFGPPYGDLVAGALGDHGVRMGRGLYLRIGNEPVSADHLSDRYPRLPERLVRAPDRPSDKPAHDIPPLE